MNRQTIQQVIDDANEVIKRARVVLDTPVERYDHVTETRKMSPWHYTHDNPKAQGALRRASMELTRSLAAMRKP